MSDIGGIGNVGGGPSVASLQRQEQGSDPLSQQRQTQEQLIL